MVDHILQTIQWYIWNKHMKVWWNLFLWKIYDKYSIGCVNMGNNPFKNYSYLDVGLHNLIDKCYFLFLMFEWWLSIHQQKDKFFSMIMNIQKAKLTFDLSVILMPYSLISIITRGGGVVFNVVRRVSATLGGKVKHLITCEVVFLPQIFSIIEKYNITII